VLLPLPGLAGDIDEFASWVHALSIGPIGHAYDIDLTFPPVMVYIWSVLAAVEPAFRTVTDAADPWIRVLMKLPPTLADLGLAAGVAFALRSRPWLAVAACLAIWLHPAVIDVSALFAQYESIYVFLALVGFLLAVARRSNLAAIALALALMTKPQALPLMVPFGAWFLAREGWRGSVRLALIGAGTIVVVWLPFLAAGGPAGYLHSLQLHQDDLFSVLSLRAWNPWWIFQTAVGGGQFVSDQSAILGPITLRHIGFVAAGLGELIVLLAVYRSPSPHTLALGLAASAMVAFTFLTTMHERYAYAAVVFLVLLIPERPMRWLACVFGIVFTLNLLAAAPPTPDLKAVLPIDGWLGIAGSVAMTAITAALVGLLVERSRAQSSDPTPTAIPA
jgi:Gpi18-like mannosyltransferase